MKYFLLLLLILVSGYGIKRPPVVIVFYSDVPVSVRNQLTNQLTADIHSFYNIDVMVGVSRQLPNFAYYKKRDRYIADSLLVDLYRVSGYKVVGITSHDISTYRKNKGSNWGILGLGSNPGKTCVVSYYRMESKNTQTFVYRVDQVVLHEVGHTFGLEHCDDNQCLMKAGDGSIYDLDHTPLRLCEICKKKL